jgi:hypothetical protein
VSLLGLVLLAVGAGCLALGLGRDELGWLVAAIGASSGGLLVVGAEVIVRHRGS